MPGGGSRLARPTGSSRKPLYRRPGKRSAAGQDTSDAIPVFVSDGGINALPGLLAPPAGLYNSAGQLTPGGLFHAFCLASDS